jgi:hypothetical protein
MNIETEDLRLIKIDLGWHDDRVREVLEKNMRKTCTEISAIYVDLSELWKINLLATRAVNLKSRCFQGVTESNRKNLLLVTESSWTETINS